MVALFPLALPIILLTAVALLPLLVLLLAAGLVVAAVALPLVLLRKLGKLAGRIRPRRRGPAPVQPAPRPATPA